MNESSLDSLLDQVMRGDSDAFCGVVRAHNLPLRAYLASQLHHLDEVDDLAQEVFLAAFRSLGTFRRGDDFGAWLRGIARHKMQNHLRSGSRLHSALDRFREEVRQVVENKLETAAGPESSELIEALLQCISKLPERMRRVVRGGLDGQKPSALARAMSTTVRAVYNLHHRANRLLRECVERETA